MLKKDYFENTELVLWLLHWKTFIFLFKEILIKNLLLVNELIN